MNTYFKEFKNLAEYKQWINNRNKNEREIRCTSMGEGYKVEYVIL